MIGLIGRWDKEESKPYVKSFYGPIDLGAYLSDITQSPRGLAYLGQLIGVRLRDVLQEL
jgi:hypothetical protein